jgi:site-specific DNA-methyltransferase (adenine-specific)
MRYLCRLVTPPGGVVLDPFMGSGSTGRGAVLEGVRCVGIERDAEYVAVARARIAQAHETRAMTPSQPSLWEDHD